MTNLLPSRVKTLAVNINNGDRRVNMGIGDGGEPMDNPLKLKNLHHLEFWVGNAKQAAYYYRHAFGFSQTGYAGLETGQREYTSYSLQQDRARLVMTTPLIPDHPASEYVKEHGDGVRDLAFEVENTDCAFETAVDRGAQPAIEPRTLADENGEVRHAAVHTYGDTIHSFYEFRDYSGPFLPGYRRDLRAGDGIGVVRVDHVVGNVELGKMHEWADFYSRVFGFHRFISFDDKDISTEYSALMSIVMSDDQQVV